MAVSKGKLLIVEDEKDLVEALTYNFRREGYQVLSSKTAEKGLTLARRHRPDLVIIDIMLPGMDGLELCRRLREESQVAVLFLTAKKDKMDEVLGFRVGGDDYVKKPFSMVELLTRVEAVLRRARLKPGLTQPSPKPSRRRRG